MKRIAIWIVATIAVIVVIASGIFIAIERSRPRLVGGPVAIVQGNPPKHGFLGIEFQPERTTALKVKHVVSGTGADQAGILPGDVIVAMEGQPLSTVKDLLRIIQDTKPDSIVLITIRRDDVEQEMNVRLISVKEMLLLQEQDRMEMQVP